jgi:hypothetical protein
MQEKLPKLDLIWSKIKNARNPYFLILNILGMIKIISRYCALNSNEYKYETTDIIQYPIPANLLVKISSNKFFWSKGKSQKYVRLWSNSTFLLLDSALFLSRIYSRLSRVDRRARSIKKVVCGQLNGLSLLNSGPKQWHQLRQCPLILLPYYNIEIKGCYSEEFLQKYRIYKDLLVVSRIKIK